MKRVILAGLCAVHAAGCSNEGPERPESGLAGLPGETVSLEQLSSEPGKYAGRQIRFFVDGISRYSHDEVEDGIVLVDDFGLHILGVRMGDLGERWRMTWYELSPTWPNTLESRSLDTLMIQALQLHARSTAETVIAVRQMVGRV